MALAEPTNDDGNGTLIDAQVERNLGRTVRLLLGYRETTVPQLADRIGLHPQSLRDRLNGKCRFTVADIADIAHALDIPHEWLFVEDPDELLRSRCFSIVDPGAGQLELPLDVRPPALTLVTH
jgi:transcriptional regulator with XRE-family HTH domain